MYTRCDPKIHGFFKYNFIITTLIGQTFRAFVSKKNLKIIIKN